MGGKVGCALESRSYQPSPVRSMLTLGRHCLHPAATRLQLHLDRSRRSPAAGDLHHRD